MKSLRYRKPSDPAFLKARRQAAFFFRVAVGGLSIGQAIEEARLIPKSIARQGKILHWVR